MTPETFLTFVATLLFGAFCAFLNIKAREVWISAITMAGILLSLLASGYIIVVAFL
jgi:hypothetical protein